ARQRGRPDRVPGRPASGVRETTGASPYALRTDGALADEAPPATARHRVAVLLERRLRGIDRYRRRDRGSRACSDLGDRDTRISARVSKCRGPGPPAATLWVM